MDKVFIAGGGTGGHFYPALALATKMKEKGYDVVYIGTTAGIEAVKDFPPGKKILYDMFGVRGKSFTKRIKGILSLLKTTYKVYRVIKKERPKFAVCFGGYASLPLGLASFLSSTKLYIHEQNSIPSYTNLMLSKFARMVFITFDYSKKFFNQDKTFLTGLPMRENIVKQALGFQPKDKVRDVLVLGGSQGAKGINEVVIKVAEHYPDITFHIILGKTKIDTDIPKNVKTYQYIDDMEKIYMETDIAISRAGSSVVNELLAFGKYAIYIPYPYAASNHQYFNVKYLKDLQLSDLIEEKDLSEDTLKQALDRALTLNLPQICSKIKKLSITDATHKILKLIEEDIYAKDR